MDDKKLTPTESMELIASMISSTKKRLIRGEGNMLLFWGYLCVSVALLDILTEYMKYRVGLNVPFKPDMIWWLVPLVGIPYTLHVNRRNKSNRTVMTYSDSISVSLWKYVLWLVFFAFIIGAIFFISGFPVWYIIELFTFFVVGMATSVQGIIIKERSMIFGGGFSVICGGFLMAGIISGNYCLGVYSLPLFIMSYIVMMIIPGHILNHKAKNNK